MLALQVVTVLLIATTMSLALTHVLELPGKLRLDEQTYLAVQTIYYPGFTIGGICEPLAIIATAVLLLVGPKSQPQFWLTLAACLAIVCTQLVFWCVTQPANRFWLKNQELSTAGERFFGVVETKQAEQNRNNENWRHLRNRWEYSHAIRAVFSATALILMVVAVAM
jgi:Domain of unknown function (DUF1772)